MLAIDRDREYLADEMTCGSTITAWSDLRALEKLRDDNTVVHYATKATAQMWIEQPLDHAQQHQFEDQQAVRYPPPTQRASST